MEYELECSDSELLEDIDCLTSFSEFHKPREVKLVPNTYGRGGRIPALHEIRLPRKFSDYRSYNPPERGRGRGSISKTSRMMSFHQDDTSSKDPLFFNKSIEAECQKDSASHSHDLYLPLTSHSDLPPAIPPAMPCKDQKLHQTKKEKVISKSLIASSSTSFNEIQKDLYSTFDNRTQNKTDIKQLGNFKKCDQNSKKGLKHMDNDYKEEDNHDINRAKAVFSSINQSELALYEKVPFPMEAYEHDGSFLSPDTFVLTQKQESDPLFSGSLSIGEQQLSIKNDNPLTCNSECLNDGMKPDLENYSAWSEIAEDSDLDDTIYAGQLEDEFDSAEKYEDNENLDNFKYNPSGKLYSFDDSNSFQMEKILAKSSFKFEFKTEEFPSLKATGGNDGKKKSKKQSGKKKCSSLKSLANSLMDGNQNKDGNQSIAHTDNSSKKKSTYVDIKNFSPGISKKDIYDYIKDFGDIQHLEIISNVNSITARVWMKDSSVACWIDECLKGQQAPLGDKTRTLETVMHSDDLYS